LHDTQRIEEIRRSFEERGWRFSLEEQRGSWAAWFFQDELGPVVNDVVRRPTALRAALAAWEKFRGEPHLAGNSRPVE
jgi:hypothetical protein